MRKILIIFLLIILIILNILDGISTFLVIRKSSIRAEKNPLARFVFRKMGVTKGIIAIKSIIIPLLVLLLYDIKHDPDEVITALFIADLIYSYTVVNNYRVHHKLKKISFRSNQL